LSSRVPHSPLPHLQSASSTPCGPDTISNSPKLIFELLRKKKKKQRTTPEINKSQTLEEIRNLEGNIVIDFFFYL